MAENVDLAITAPTTVRAFDDVRAKLHKEFDGRLPVDRFDQCFAAEVAKFHDARVTAYLHILIHRSAQARLRVEQRRLHAQR